MELSNAQVALLAAAEMTERGADSDIVTGRADMFVLWLERQDRELREAVAARVDWDTL